MQKIPLSLSILLATATAHANTDAGTTLRDATQKVATVPATINPLTAETTNISTDNTPITVSRVLLQGNTLLADSQLQPLLTSLNGQTTTFGGLQKLASDITALYHKAGYPLVSIIIPPQKIADGTVILQVIEGKIDKVALNNQSRLKDSIVQSYLDKAIVSGQYLRQADSERALLLIKDLAGTDDVNYRLDPHSDGTNLAVHLGQAKAINGNISVDNYGSKSTGRMRTRAGLDLNSPFGRGERISLQAMSSFKGVDYANLGAELPIGYNGLSVNTNISHTRYDLGGAFKDLDAKGNATTFSAGLRYPLIRSNTQNVWLTAGGEYRKLRDEVGATDTTTRKNIRSANLGVNASFQDNWLAGGYTQLSLNNTFGRLNIKDLDAKAIDDISAKTSGNFYKLNLSVGRTQYLSQKWSVYAGVNGQITNKNLDSSEQLSLGGADAISAYHSNDVSADEGVIGQMELRYALNPYLTLSGFYEAGRAKLRDKPYLVDLDNTVSLRGGGVGLYANYKGFNLQTKLAWHGHHSSTINTDKGMRFWVKVGYQF